MRRCSGTLKQTQQQVFAAYAITSQALGQSSAAPKLPWAWAVKVTVLMGNLLWALGFSPWGGEMTGMLRFSWLAEQGAPSRAVGPGCRRPGDSDVLHRENPSRCF